MKYYIDLLRRELVKEWRGEESGEKDEYEALKPENKEACDELTEHINDNILKYDKRLKEKKKNKEDKRTWSVDNSTIERLFGYKDKEIWKGPSLTTLSLLSKSLQYKSWGLFKLKNGETYSFPVPTIEEIFESQRKEILLLLEQGIPNDSGIYIFGWEPIKYSKLKHLGGFKFEVIESKNMYKEKGQTFISPDFILSKDVGKMEIKDIMIYDYDGDYFENQPKCFEEEFDDNYFYL